MITLEENFNTKQKLLAATMTAFSTEEHFGWKEGIEFSLWKEAQKACADRPGDGRLALCRQLSDELQGWVCWSEQEGLNVTGDDYDGLVFVSLDVWKLFLEFEAKVAEVHGQIQAAMDRLTELADEYEGKIRGMQ